MNSSSEHAAPRSSNQRWSLPSIWIHRAATPIAVRDHQPSRLSCAQPQDRCRRNLGAAPGQDLRKDFYASQFVSTHAQKIQSPPPSSVGRVVWTFQLCRNRTLLLCAYMHCWRPIEMSLCAPNRNVSVNPVAAVRWKCVESSVLWRFPRSVGRVGAGQFHCLASMLSIRPSFPLPWPTLFSARRLVHKLVAVFSYSRTSRCWSSP
jgi:hypothetical protein